MLKQVLNSRMKVLTAAAVAALIALPTLSQARAHYTGTLPASVMMAAATSSPHTAAHSHRTLASHRHARLTSTTSHKKAQALTKKKGGKKKHHKKKKK